MHVYAPIKSYCHYTALQVNSNVMLFTKIGFDGLMYRAFDLYTLCMRLASSSCPARSLGEINLWPHAIRNSMLKNSG